MQTEARSGRDLSLMTKSLSVEVTEPCKNVKPVNDMTKSPCQKGSPHGRVEDLERLDEETGGACTSSDR